MSAQRAIQCDRASPGAQTGSVFGGFGAPGATVTSGGEAQRCRSQVRSAYCAAESSDTTSRTLNAIRSSTVPRRIRKITVTVIINSMINTTGRTMPRARSRSVVKACFIVASWCVDLAGERAWARGTAHRERLDNRSTDATVGRRGDGNRVKTCGLAARLGTRLVGRRRTLR